MKPTIGRLILVLFSCCCFTTAAQEVHIKHKTERIIIHADSSFTKNIKIRFDHTDGPSAYPIFYDSELETVSNINVGILKGRKFKSFDDFRVKEEKIELDYIASKKVKSILLPPEGEYELTYTVTCKQLMYLSGLRLFSQHAIDTLDYKISMSEAFHLSHDLIHGDSLQHFVMDSTVTDNLKNWSFEAVPEKIAPDPLTFFGIYRNKKSPLLRLAVVPASYRSKERQYLNDWYLQQVKYKRGLDAEAIQRIDQLTAGVTDPVEITQILYDFVRQKFKYVAIEIGMGAFIPSHTNEVFDSKQGDCKDLSNFLVEALKYKGIEGYLALAATQSHISDCDFPSLSSANHIVCLVELEGRTVLLDPTDPIHVTNTPVQSLQNRTVLIFDQDGGQWHRVAGYSSEKNRIGYEMDLVFDPDTREITGDFTVAYHGITGNFLKRELWYNNETTVRSDVKRFYEGVFKNQSIADFRIEPTPEVVRVRGKLTLTGKLFKDGTDKLLFLDFVPRLFESFDRERLLDGMQLETNFSKNVRIRISMDAPIADFETVSHSSVGAKTGLDLKIANAGENAVLIQYDFKCDYDRIQIDNIEEVNQILDNFKKIVNEPITLKQKV